MTWAIPRQSSSGAQPKAVVAMRKGDRGIQVWALQSAVDDLRGITCGTDGVFGPQTESAVKAAQRLLGKTADGIAGPVTQRAIAVQLLEDYGADVPHGLMDGFAAMEGGWLLAAVNSSVAGGTDCGLLQRRVYSGDYDDDAVIQRAFDTRYQVDLLGRSLVNLRSIFAARAGTQDGYAGMGVREKAWRLAALNHNYPSGATRLSYTPIRSLASYWTTPQSWVTVHGFRFPDGAAVRTPLEWCHLYAGVLGGAHGHHGNVTRYVRTWG